MGITWWQFWGLNPHKIKIIAIGYNEQKIEFDAMMHAWWGSYGLSAVSVAVEHCLAGKKAKSKYIDKPMLSQLREEMKNNSLTQEEIDNRELQKMIYAEEMWAKQHKRKGLPETVIL